MYNFDHSISEACPAPLSFMPHSPPSLSAHRCDHYHHHHRSILQYKAMQSLLTFCHSHIHVSACLPPFLPLTHFYILAPPSLSFISQPQLFPLSSYPPFWKWAQHHFQTESWIPRISWNMVALKPESEYTYIHLIISKQILDVTLKNSFWNVWSSDLVSNIHLWWPCLWSNSHSQCTSLDPSGFSPQCWAGTCLMSCHLLMPAQSLFRENETSLSRIGLW